MSKEYAVSFCDTVFPGFVQEDWQNEIDRLKNNREISRIYVGSYFCENYFLRYSYFDFLKFDNWAKNNLLKISVCIPVCRQERLDEVKGIVRRVLDLGFVDEVVVNDVGMLAFMRESYPNLQVHLGRLFFKNTRDPRNLKMEVNNNELSYSAFYSTLYDEFLFAGLEVDAISLDMDFGNFPQDIMISIHQPWAYLSVGRMCTFAGAGLINERKFIADEQCKLECIGNPIFYNHESGLIVKSGKTVYSPAIPTVLSGIRNVREIYQVTKWEHENE